MAGCFTCRQRKVKCDGRPDICQRCDKLAITCNWKGPSFKQNQSSQEDDPFFTKAGHKRLRNSVACETCRSKKLKCDALQPSCSLCSRRGLDCRYIAHTRVSKRQKSDVLAQSDSGSPYGQSARSIVGNEPNFRNDCSLSGASIREKQGEGTNSSQARNITRFNPRLDEERTGEKNATREAGATMSEKTDGVPQLPSRQEILPYIDAYLENVHPICCNNFLHAGALCDAIDRAPRLLVLAICGPCVKFMADSKNNIGQRWVDEAKALIFNSLNSISALTVSAIQLLILHDLDRGEYTSAWNLAGISIRMALQLKLYDDSSGSQDNGTVVEQECRRRLMWSVYVSDLLFNSDSININDELVAGSPLPCNLYSFTQGIPCKTLTLKQLRTHIPDGPAKQASNHCSYLINILVIRRKILRYISYLDHERELPWEAESSFQALCNELEMWQGNLPPNYDFIERHMYTFRVSRHLDIFLMIHAWYHDCCCLLFGAWMPAHPGNIIGELELERSRSFTQDCTDRCLSHARDITVLIQKTLNVESNHLFRDPWFGFCIWDSAAALLASVEHSGVDPDYKENIAKLLKLNLKALALTRDKIPLAGKIYNSVCMLVQQHGLTQLVGLEDRDQKGFLEPLHITSSDGTLRRYPFLGTVNSADSAGWNNLFKAPELIPVPSRVSLPEMPVPRTTVATNFGVAQNTSQSEEGSYMDENLVQTLYPWLMEDFQWQQDLQAYIDPQAAAAITGMMYQAPSGTIAASGQQQMNLSHDHFMPVASMDRGLSFDEREAP